MTEQEIVRQCLQYLHAAGVFSWRVNSGAVSGEYKGKRRFVRFQSINGVSDILGVLDGGIMLAVEVKKPGGKLSLHQRSFLEEVRRRGGVALVVYGVDELIERLKEVRRA